MRQDSDKPEKDATSVYGLVCIRSDKHVLRQYLVLADEKESGYPRKGLVHIGSLTYKFYDYFF